MEKSNDGERIYIELADDPKCQGDLQGHMIFYMTSKSHGLPIPLLTNCGSIQSKIRKISAIETLMTS